MLTYVGKGYSQAFTDNYDTIVARLAAGEDIIMQEGPDEICQPLLDTADPHCHRPSVEARDAQALHDVGHVLGRTLHVGDIVSLDGAGLERLRQAFLEGVTRTACTGCEWFDLCTAVSADGYAGVKLLRC